MDKDIIPNSNHNSDNISDKFQSVGQILKANRVERKLEVEQVANQLNLSNHTIEQIESDNYDELPEMTYVRGYIVSYCRLLDLGSKEVLKNLAYDELNQPAPAYNDAPISVSQDSKSVSTVVKVLLLICVLGGVAWIYIQNNTITSDSIAINDNLSTEEDNSQATTKGSNAGSNENRTISVKSNSSLIDQDRGQNDSLEVLTEQKEIPAKVKNLLELEFNSISWVDVQDQDKNKLVYQSFPRGEVYKIKAELPLNIFIDNAEGVIMRYEGKEIDLKSKLQEDGYAKFTLGEE